MRKRTDVKSRALIVARRLLSERGFEGMSLQDVAAEIGVSKQAVLHHFASKDALRRAVMSELIAAVAGEDSIAFFTSHPEWARVLLREMLDRPTAANAFVKALHSRPEALQLALVRAISIRGTRSKR